MHPLVSSHKFIKSSLDHISTQFKQNSEHIRIAVSAAIGSSEPQALEQEMANLAEQFAGLSVKASAEPSHGDVDYVSREDGVGLYQSVLAHVFSRIPGLQGYGDHNPIWVVTLIEEGVYALGSFFKAIHEDVHGNKEPLIQAFIKEWKNLKFERAPYPVGTPEVVKLPPGARIALLADWGGNNPAAQHIAAVVRKQKPHIAIHLGDIYYGGVSSECESFLRLWPLQTNVNYPQLGIPPGTSYALNGNHEMYSGGESYFNIVLKAFGQPQPFFCLESDYWRIFGLDTAYAGGRLNTSNPADPINNQWNWLVQKLRDGDKNKRNIFLTHHQPVSAHRKEFLDSQSLRDDIELLLSTSGLDRTTIFGWFFGHEHRCALYRDTATDFNARLIGNGCIPHEVQTERESDQGCTPVDYFNKRQNEVNSGAAVSMCAMLTFQDSGPELLIEYIDEDFQVWGSEVWNASKGRFGGSKFQETDFDSKLRNDG